jgi:hypothetical protein
MARVTMQVDVEALQKYILKKCTATEAQEIMEAVGLSELQPDRAECLTSPIGELQLGEPIPH